MESSPIISFIVPVYNVELYLEECLQSLYAVKNITIEVVLIDDGSTDSSPQIMSKFVACYPDITVAKRQENAGLSDARNSGLKLAAGRYVSFVDSDDFIDPEKFTRLIQMNIDTNADVFQGNGDAIWGNEWQHHKTLSDLRRFGGVTNGISFFDHFLRAGNHIAVWDKVYKRSFLLDNKINFIKGLLHEDVPFLFSSFLLAKSVTTSDINFYLYRQREGSIMSKLDTRSAESRFTIVDHLLNTFNKMNIKNKSFYDYLVYQLWRARETTSLYNPKLTKALIGKPISFKKMLQCFIMLIKK